MPQRRHRSGRGTIPTERFASKNQLNWIKRCLDERDTTNSGLDWTDDLRTAITASPENWGEKLPFALASAYLDALFGLPLKTGGIDKEGGYYLFEDEVYNVRRAENGENLYAMVLDVREDDTGVKTGEWVYAKGAMLNLRADMEISVEKAAELSAEYHVCVICGTELTDPKSIEPVCVKKLRLQAELDAEHAAANEGQQHEHQADEKTPITPPAEN